MTTILFVDDDPEWQDILTRALPDYDVVIAASYVEALDRLTDGKSYEIAIVDLNLVSLRPDQRGTGILGNDQLGVKILCELRDNYPATRRVVITGSVPDTVNYIFEEYGADGLLYKQKLDFSQVRKMVETSVDLAHADVPADVRAMISGLGDRFAHWKQGRGTHFDAVAELRNDEIREAGNLGQPAEYWLRKLTALKEEVQQFTSECASFTRTMAFARNSEDAEQAAREFSRLKRTFGAEGTE